MARIMRAALAALLVAGLAGTAQAERRVALVIGNSAYRNTAALANPSHDAADVAAKLRSLGFEVIERADLDKQGMDNAFREFAHAQRGADATLFYYAGHAMQFGGVNYLVPVDATLADEADLPYEMAKLDDVVADMSRANGVRMVMLDACRDNPLEDKLKQGLATTRSMAVTRGLARIPRTHGLLVAYSTQPGEVAADGGGRNSPFTAAFLNHVDTPGLEVGPLFRRVAADVNRETDGKQTPELSVSLLGEFYFAGEAPAPQTTAVEPANAEPESVVLPPASTPAAAVERWLTTIQVDGRSYTCVNETQPNGRYRMSDGCPAPLAGETGWGEITPDGAWRMRADNGRVDFGTLEVRDADHIVVHSTGGTSEWVRLATPAK